MGQKLSIVSLGWLGLAVYNHFQVKLHCSGSYLSKSKDVENEYRFDINCFEELPKFLKEADIVFVNLPPSTIYSLESLKRFFCEVKNKRVILVSSTSVYEQDGLVDEQSPLLKISKRSTKQVEIEELLVSIIADHLILRCAGLYGADRHPGNYLSGKEDISGSKSPVNLVSREDILFILDKTLFDCRERVVNLVNINHPEKENYYNEFCLKNGLEKISFNSSDSTKKIVNSLYSEFVIKSKLP